MTKLDQTIDRIRTRVRVGSLNSYEIIPLLDLGQAVVQADREHRTSKHAFAYAVQQAIKHYEEVVASL